MNTSYCSNSDLFTVKTKNLSEAISEKLIEMIYVGQLMPGQKLVQGDLADKFNVSRVAIRDALKILRENGLAIVNNSIGGMCVYPITSKDISNVAFVRRSIEPSTAAIACSQITELGIKQLELIISKQENLCALEDYAGYMHADWDFHKSFYLFSENTLAVDVIEKAWLRANQARGLALADPKRGQNWCLCSIDGHKRMLEIIKKRDLDAISQLVKDNIIKAENDQIAWLGFTKN